MSERTDKEQELLFIIGLMLQECGGRLDISKHSQLEYKHGEKELMVRLDPITSIMSVKLQKPHKVSK